jgi:hypothetical protein
MDRDGYEGRAIRPRPCIESSSLGSAESRSSQVEIGEITRIIEIERIEEIVPVQDPHPTPPFDPDSVPA